MKCQTLFSSKNISKCMLIFPVCYALKEMQYNVYQMLFTNNLEFTPLKKATFIANTRSPIYYRIIPIEQKSAIHHESTPIYI